MKNFPIIRSRRLRSTPYTERIEAHGVSGYTVYNHMLLPVSFKSIEDDYNHLKKYVQVWDVAAERQVEISGKDSAELVQLMTCRDLSKSKIGKCYYAPLIDQEGLLVNDPIINKLENEKEIEKFLKDLCTPSELNAFEERWEVAKLLYKKDMSYRDIAKTLKTSTATVTRVARFLFNETNKGYQIALKKLINE